MRKGIIIPAPAPKRRTNDFLGLKGLSADFGGSDPTKSS